MKYTIFSGFQLSILYLIAAKSDAKYQ